MISVIPQNLCPIYANALFIYVMSEGENSEHWNGIPRTRVRVPVEMHVFHISSIDQNITCFLLQSREDLY